MGLPAYGLPSGRETIILAVSRVEESGQSFGQLSPLFTWRSAINSDLHELSHVQRYVALSLSLHMNEKGGSCFPSLATLAKETNMGRSTLQRAIATLTTKGWLIRSLNTGRGHANTYTAMVPLSVGVMPRSRALSPIKGPAHDHKGPRSGALGRHEDVKEIDLSKTDNLYPPDPTPEERDATIRLLREYRPGHGE